MNESERESIMKMVADGDLRPDQAAKLLARLAEEQEATVQSTRKSSVPEEPKEKPKPATERITIPSADGTERTIEVPSSLVPMIGKMVGEALKQHTKKVVKETVAGARIMARNKKDEVVDTVRTAMKGGNKKVKVEEKPAVSPEEQQQLEARRRILQMVQNGRITAGDASRLIQELDALHAYEKAQSAPPEINGASRRK